jgi:hypothetical protein
VPVLAACNGGGRVYRCDSRETEDMRIHSFVVGGIHSGKNLDIHNRWSLPVGSFQTKNCDVAMFDQ